MNLPAHFSPQKPTLPRQRTCGSVHSAYHFLESVPLHSCFLEHFQTFNRYIDIEKAIDCVSVGAAPGITEIRNNFLKMTLAVSDKILFFLFQQFLEYSKLPLEYKFYKVRLLFTTDAKSDPMNCTPISLTTVPAKYWSKQSTPTSLTSHRIACSYIFSKMVRKTFFQ